MSRAGLEGVEDILPLSAVQSGMLYEAIAPDAAPGLYIGGVLAKLTGPLDPAGLRQAFETEVLSRDAYRVALFWEGLKQPVQMVQTHLRVPWKTLDYSHLGKAEAEAKVTALLQAERRKPLNLNAAPLMRFTLVKVSETEHRLLWIIHHLISDGWSTGTVLQSALARYHGVTPSAPPLPYKRFLAWQKAQDVSAAQAFWTEYLQGCQAASLPSDKLARIGNTGEEPARLTHHVPADAWDRLTRFARDARTTPQTLLTALWALVLRRYTGDNDVLFGTTNAGRPTQLKGVETAAGAFLNTLPIRFQIDPSQTLRDYLGKAGESANARRAFETTPLPVVAQAAPLPRGTPLFEVIFVFEDFPKAPPLDGATLTLSDVTREDASAAPLAVLVHPDDGLRIDAIVKPGLRAEIADAMLRDFAALISSVEDHADLPLKDSLVTAFAPTALPALPLRDDPLILSQIYAQAQRMPDRCALDDGQKTLSYGELIERVEGLAGAFQSEGLMPGDCLAIALPRGVEAVIAMLAAWRLGAGYTPVDLSYPKERQAQVLAAANPKLVLRDTHSDEPNALNIAALEPHPILMPHAASGDDLAYLIFTSGSSGRPKGVPITQANLAYSTGARAEVYPSAPTAFVHLSSFAFDSSIVGLFWTLSAGGTLHIAPPQIEQDLAALGVLLRRAGPAHLLALPSLYAALLDAKPDALSQLECVIVAGEAASADLVDAHENKASQARLFNEYGPTEASVWCAAAELKPGEPVTIGTAPPGSELVVMDPDGCPLPPGLSGELWVRGPGLSPGYWQRPDLDANAFPTRQGQRYYRTGDLAYRDTQGAHVYLGRRDKQIKLRGHRIELAEIEAQLAQAASGAETALWVADGQLVAALQGTSEAANTAFNTLRDRLPGYMVPAIIHAVPQFPRLPNGKLDQARLEAHVETPPKNPPNDRPLTLMEEKLRAVWAEVLKRDDITTSSNFFELGGDSLKTITLVLKAEDAGLAIAGHEIFDAPVLADLAQRLEARAMARISQRPDTNFALANETGTKAPFFMIHGSLEMYSYLSAALGADRPLGFLFSHFLQGDLKLSDRVEDMIEDAYHRLKSVRSEGPYHIGGYSIGAVVAVGLAARLASEGDEVGTLFLLDPSYGIWRRTRDRLKHRAIGRVMPTAWGLAANLGLKDAHRARNARVSHGYRRMLTYYTPPQFDGPAHLMMTTDGEVKAEGTGWMEVSLPNATRHRLDLDHFRLQDDPDALLTWTTDLSQRLRQAESKS